MLQEAFECLLTRLAFRAGGRLVFYITKRVLAKPYEEDVFGGATLKSYC